MLTPESVLYVEDILDQALVSNKRAANNITMIQNEDVRTYLKNVQEKLKEHYQTLLAILGNETK